MVADIKQPSIGRGPLAVFSRYGYGAGVRVWGGRSAMWRTFCYLAPAAEACDRCSQAKGRIDQMLRLQPSARPNRSYKPNARHIAERPPHTQTPATYPNARPIPERPPHTRTPATYPNARHIPERPPHTRSAGGRRPEASVRTTNI